MRHQPPRKWLHVTLAIALVVQVALAAVSLVAFLTYGQWSGLVITMAWAMITAILFVQRRKAYVQARHAYLAHQSSS